MQLWILLLLLKLKTVFLLNCLTIWYEVIKNKLVLIMLLIAFSAIFSAMHFFCFIFVCCKTFFLYCWWVFLFRYFYFDDVISWVVFYCEVDEIDEVNNREINYFNLMFISFIIFNIRLNIWIKLAIFWITIIVKATIDDCMMRSIDLTKKSIVILIVNTNISFKKFF